MRVANQINEKKILKRGNVPSSLVRILFLNYSLLILALERYKRKQSSRRSLPPRALHLRRLRLCYLRDYHESSGICRTVIQSLKLVQNISN